MNRTVWKSGGTALLMMGLAACGEVELTRAPYTIELTNPAADQANIPLVFDAVANVGGGFVFADSPCDPTDVHVDLNTYAMAADWDPYNCTEEDGSVSQDEGNIQLFIDGIFFAYAASATVPVDMSPKVGPFAYYDYIYDDAGEPVPDVDGDGNEDLFKYCSMYFPDDTLGYASTYYTEAISPYTFPNYYGVNLNDLDVYAETGTVVPLATQPVPYDTIFDFFFNAPFLKFDYFRANAATGVEEHIWWAELHAVNHSTIFGPPREITYTQGFAITDADGDGLADDFPADWCGNFGFANVF